MTHWQTRFLAQLSKYGQLPSVWTKIIQRVKLDKPVKSTLTRIVHGNSVSETKLAHLQSALSTHRKNTRYTVQKVLLSVLLVLTVVFGFWQRRHHQLNSILNSIETEIRQFVPHEMTIQNLLQLSSTANGQVEPLKNQELLHTETHLLQVNQYRDTLTNVSFDLTQSLDEYIKMLREITKLLQETPQSPIDMLAPYWDQIISFLIYNDANVNQLSLNDQFVTEVKQSAQVQDVDTIKKRLEESTKETEGPWNKLNQELIISLLRSAINTSSNDETSSDDETSSNDEKIVKDSSVRRIQEEENQKLDGEAIKALRAVQNRMFQSDIVSKLGRARQTISLQISKVREDTSWRNVTRRLTRQWKKNPA